MAKLRPRSTCSCSGVGAMESRLPRKNCRTVGLVTMSPEIPQPQKPCATQSRSDVANFPVETINSRNYPPNKKIRLTVVKHNDLNNQDSDIDFTGGNLVEMFDLARVVNQLAAAGKILRIVGPTFAAEQAWKTYATDLMAHKVPGSNGEESEPKKCDSFVCFVFEVFTAEVKLHCMPGLLFWFFCVLRDAGSQRSHLIGLFAHQGLLVGVVLFHS